MTVSYPCAAHSPRVSPPEQAASSSNSGTSWPAFPGIQTLAEKSCCLISELQWSAGSRTPLGSPERQLGRCQRGVFRCSFSQWAECRVDPCKIQRSTQVTESRNSPRGKNREVNILLGAVSMRRLRIWVLGPYSFLGLSGLIMPCTRLSPD